MFTSPSCVLPTPTMIRDTFPALGDRLFILLRAANKVASTRFSTIDLTTCNESLGGKGIRYIERNKASNVPEIMYVDMGENPTIMLIGNTIKIGVVSVIVANAKATGCYRGV